MDNLEHQKYENCYKMLKIHSWNWAQHGQCKGTRHARIVLGFFIWEGFLVPPWLVSADTAKQCWPEEFYIGNFPKCAIDGLSVLAWPYTSLLLENNKKKHVEMHTNKIKWWKIHHKTIINQSKKHIACNTYQTPPNLNYCLSSSNTTCIENFYAKLFSSARTYENKNTDTNT